MTDEKWIDEALWKASLAAEVIAETRVAESLTRSGADFPRKNPVDPSVPMHPNCRCVPMCDDTSKAGFPMICGRCGRKWRRLYPEPKWGEMAWCVFCKRKVGQRKDDL